MARLRHRVPGTKTSKTSQSASLKTRAGGLILLEAILVLERLLYSGLERGSVFHSVLVVVVVVVVVVMVMELVMLEVMG